MKIFKSIIILLFLLLPVHAYSSTIGKIHISLLKGDVQIKTEETLEWVPASINMPLKEGDSLWVPEDSRLEIRFLDGTCLRLDENSAVEILTVQGDSFQFYISLGHAYVNFKGLRDNLIQFDTPVSSIRVYNPSKFKIDISQDGFTEISVIKGIVYAESRSGKTTVSAGKKLSIGEELYAELSPIGPSDDWERWNRERDRRLSESRYSYKYLPEELHSYSCDLDYYGRWLYTSDYGYVWTPSLYISVGWSPYRIGRWVWIGGNYIWVSYEPWGWVPYHYGRWSYIVSIGWVWIPPIRSSVYWGPGYVGWIYNPYYIGWFPLAPGEIYYGYGYYGPYSVNLYNVNINNIFLRNRYRHPFLENGLIIVNRKSFLKGKYMQVRLKENPFLRGPVSIGIPQIKPGRAASIPVLREIPKTKQPPLLVKNMHVKELKKERSLVRNKRYSVMNSGNYKKTMPIKKSLESKIMLANTGTGEKSIIQRGVYSNKNKRNTNNHIIKGQQRANTIRSSKSPSIYKEKSNDYRKQNSNIKYSRKRINNNHRTTTQKTYRKYEPQRHQESKKYIAKRYPTNPVKTFRNSRYSSYTHKQYRSVSKRVYNYKTDNIRRFNNRNNTYNYNRNTVLNNVRTFNPGYRTVSRSGGFRSSTRFFGRGR